MLYLPGTYCDTEKAERPVRFINQLRHTSGKYAGQFFNLRPWQASDIIRPFFGTMNAETGLRQYRTLYLEIPRKNGKTGLVAGIALYLLAGDEEMSAQVYGAAGDKGQAGLMFKEAMTMVRMDPDLSRFIGIQERDFNMAYYTMNSFYRALSKVAENKHGFNASAVLIDEYHVWRDNELYNVLTTSQDARLQPVRIIITTAGMKKVKGMNTPAWEMHQYALKVRENPLLDPTFLPIIYAADDDDAWDDPKVWAKCNPALGDFKLQSGLEDMVRQARELPEKKDVFMRLHLNRWGADNVRAVISASLWKENTGTVVYGPELPDFLKGRKCFGGLDLSSTQDITALVLFFLPEEEGDRFHIWCKFWCPSAAVAKRSTSEGLQYQQWKEAGWLEETDGDVIDYNHVRDFIAGAEDAKTRVRRGGIVEQVEIVELGFDPFRATQICNDLLEDGVKMVATRQGFLTMTGPADQLEVMLFNRELAHGGNPVMAWMATNLCWAKDQNDNKKPDKRNSAEKIDGISALLTAMARWLAQPPNQNSRWNNPGGLRRPATEEAPTPDA
jgi:phage terminase large subunit-like protein